MVAVALVIERVELDLTDAIALVHTEEPDWSTHARDVTNLSVAAVLSGNRVALGVGIGWCEEEFDLLEQQFRTRGRRTDEGLALLKRLWEPGWTEFEGDLYRAPRLVMEPTPTAPIPIYVGELSEVAFARAARTADLEVPPGKHVRYRCVLG